VREAKRKRSPTAPVCMRLRDGYHVKKHEKKWFMTA
jgi:hypothetical protein